MKKRRVVITGLGVIAPNGIGKDAFWKAIKNGKSGIGKITRFDTDSFPIKIAGEVNDFDPLDYMTPKQANRMDRFSQFGVACAKMAVEDAGLCLEKEDKSKIAVAMGTTLGGLICALDQHSILMEKGADRINPFAASMANANASSGQISVELGAQGPSHTFSSACTSAYNAIGYAFNIIQRGKMNIVVAGGSESPLHPTIFGVYCLSKMMSFRNGYPIKAPQSFDKNRDGTVLSEGGGVLIIEELEHALNRGAKIYTEIIGYGETCDAYHMIAPDPEGKGGEKAIKQALESAHLFPEEIDYIHAYGTGTQLTDKLETAIIKEVFGEYAYKIPISAIKSMIGHTQGACGAIETISCILAIKNGIIPPTINYECPDPECDLDYVPNKARKADINTVLANCFGFGGKNAALVLRGI